MKVLNKFMEKACSELYYGILEKNISGIKNIIGGMTFRIVNLYAKNSLKELKDVLEKYQKLTDATAGIFETEEEKIAYQMGLLGGTTEAIRQLKENQDQIKEYQMVHFDTKYRDMIIEQLIDKDYVQHNQLAKNLNISTSQLSVIMSKLDDERQNIISISRVGKFKYYCLTDMGKRYYHSKNKGNFREEINELMQCVLDAPKKQDTVKHFIDKYYYDDLELKQKALKVDGYLYFYVNGNNAEFSNAAEGKVSYYHAYGTNSDIFADYDNSQVVRNGMDINDLYGYAARNEEPYSDGRWLLENLEMPMRKMKM